MFFQKRSREAFLEGPSADLASTGRFRCHFRFSGFPKNDPWDPIFNHKIDFSLPGGMGQGTLAPTLARLATQERIFNNFWLFFYDFGSFWDPIVVFV
jgi:hypothetical protein